MTLVFSGNRTLSVLSLDQYPGALSPRPFVALVPAFDEVERRDAEAAARLLIRQGCVELCCVGAEAELLHDSIDEIVENGPVEVVTTWHTDFFDACEYFLFAAGGGSGVLLALVGAHPELVALLEEEAQGQ